MMLVERVRCLLSHSQLPRSFWGEALGTWVHVLNLTLCVFFGVRGSRHDMVREGSFLGSLA